MQSDGRPTLIGLVVVRFAGPSLETTQKYLGITNLDSLTGFDAEAVIVGTDLQGLATARGLH